MSSYSAKNKNKLKFQLPDVANKLFHLSSSTPDILNVLMQMEKVLSRVKLPPSKATVKLLHPISQALITPKLVKHLDVNVNISVVCCMCEIIRIRAPDAPYNHEHMKEFFEVLVTSLEKQSSAGGGYVGKMTNALEIFRKARLPVMMLDVHVEGLVGRLLKQFLTSADSNNSATLLVMEKIMTMIIGESKERALDLEALIIATLDKIDSPVCWQLGEKVLLNCACKRYNIFIPDMEAKETSNEDEKKKVLTEVNGKRKRSNEQQGEPRKVFYSMTHVQGYKVKKINAPILEAIFKKHGDIASDCVVKTPSVRESILEVVCDVVKRIQTNDVATIVSDMEEIEMQVLDAEATNMKVAWLRAHLEAIQKRTVTQKKSTLIVKTKTNATLVKKAAKMDLEERRVEFRTAQERFDKAEKCVKVLDLVEMKLNDNFVESEAERDSWPEQPIL